MDNNIRLLILILLTLGESQTDIATDLRCSDHLPGETKRWFEGLPLNEASSLVNDEVVKRIVFEKLPELNLDTIKLIKAGSISAAQILRYFGKIPISEKSKPVFDISVYRKHQDDLLKMAARLQDQLWISAPWKIFNAEVCQYLDMASKAEKPVLTGLGDGLNSPILELEPRSNGKIRVSGVSLDVEHEDLYPRLLNHLNAEYDIISDIGSYKEQLVILLNTALGLALDAVTDCEVDTGAHYATAPNQPGLCYSYPALVCRSALKKDIPELDMRAVAGFADTWELIDKQNPGAALAFGSRADVKRYAAILKARIKTFKKRKAWTSLNDYITRAKMDIEPMRARLSDIVIRGYLSGKCPLCVDYQPSS